MGQLEREGRRIERAGQELIGEAVEGAPTPPAPWRTAFQRVSGSTPAFTPMVKTSANAVCIA